MRGEGGSFSRGSMELDFKGDRGGEEVNEALDISISNGVGVGRGSFCGVGGRKRERRDDSERSFLELSTSNFNTSV